jgi:hypothetical protein
MINTMNYSAEDSLLINTISISLLRKNQVFVQEDG